MAAYKRRWRAALAGTAAALVLFFVVGTPEGRSAAAQFLGQFRSQRFAVVTVDNPQRLEALAQLERLGTLQGPGGSGVSAAVGGRAATIVGSLDEASRVVGFPLLQPDPATLPAEVGRTARIRVSPAGSLRFTFDREKARAYFQSIGRPDVVLPDRFHGASLVVAIPAAAVLEYRSTAAAGSHLIVGQSKELVVGVEGGVTLEELRDFLLGLPSVSPELARQLRALNDWRTTLPVPVPIDRVQWQPATFGGASGLILADSSGLGSAAIWQHDGRVFGLAGPVQPDQLQRIAGSLR